MQIDLNRLLKLLLEYNVDFVLVGGVAASVHGSPVITQDLDICISITDTEIAKLREALKGLSPQHRMNPNYKPSFFEYPKSVNGVNNIYLETDIGVLDILSEVKPAGDFEKVKKKAITIECFGYQCKVISLEDLIAIKETMTRAKDKETLLHLREILKRRKSAK